MLELETVMTVHQVRIGDYFYRLTTITDSFLFPKPSPKNKTRISRTPVNDMMPNWSHAVLTQTLAKTGDFVPNLMIDDKLADLMTFEAAVKYLENLAVSA